MVDTIFFFYFLFFCCLHSFSSVATKKKPSSLFNTFYLHTLVAFCAEMGVHIYFIYVSLSFSS